MVTIGYIILSYVILPLQVKTKQDFKAEDIGKYNMWTLGGNHIRTALQQISREKMLNDIR